MLDCHSPGHTLLNSVPEDVRVQRIPWWLWPNVLSLDAPLVALVWSGTFALEWGGDLPSGSRLLLLALAVWCIYVGDRLWDVRRITDPTRAPLRHQFYARHATTCTVLLGLGLILGLGIAITTLPLSVWLVAAGIGLGVFGYFLQLLHRPKIPKEWACGTMFALGVLCPLVERWSFDLFLHAGVFAGLCSANCLAIASWERNLQDGSRASASPTLSTGSLSWLLAALVLLAILLWSRTSLSLGLAALSLAILVMFAQHLSQNLLRVLADLCLLTPLPIFGLLLLKA